VTYIRGILPVNSKINGNQPYFYGNYQTEPEQNKKAEQKTEQPKEKKGGWWNRLVK